MGFIVALNILGFAFFIREGMQNEASWVAIGLPLSLLGLLYIIYPPTEEWEYQPWQSQPQQIEQSSHK